MKLWRSYPFNSKMILKITSCVLSCSHPYNTTIAKVALLFFIPHVHKPFFFVHVLYLSRQEAKAARSLTENVVDYRNAPDIAVVFIKAAERAEKDYCRRHIHKAVGYMDRTEEQRREKDRRDGGILSVEHLFDASVYHASRQKLLNDAGEDIRYP